MSLRLVVHVARAFSAQPTLGDLLAAAAMGTLLRRVPRFENATAEI